LRLLLDTHVYLWWLAADPRVAQEARDAIADAASTVYVSAATIWEAGIKAAAGRLAVRGDLVEHIRVSGFSGLAITIEHARAAANLPAHHRDPFDRMLIAQAAAEGMRVVTRDSSFSAYDVPLLPA
jgi:PIN domain nuclease of toxin-antitoxin system